MPIRIPAEEIRVRADRRLAFQVLTAWGVGAPGRTPTSRVLERTGDRVLCEFYTPVRAPFGLSWVQRTVEWVTVREPDLIEFRAIKAPLPLLLCAFSLEEWGDCCRFKYDATIALHGSFLGWVFGVLFIRPMFQRMMREHLREMKETIEARAVRSRVFPQRLCPPAEAPIENAQIAQSV